MTTRTARPLAFALTVVLLAFAAWQMVTSAQIASTVDDVGADFFVYLDNGARWWATGELYFPEQIVGPHENILGHSVYYPPHALLILAPLSLLPVPVAVVAWWGIPLLMVGYALYRLRPAAWSWPVMALLLAWPRSVGAIIFGNTDMWVAAAVAAGVLWGWPFVLVTLKPSFLPLALLGIRAKRWWVAAVSLGLVSLAFLPLWFDYVAVMRNATGIGLAYSFLTLPLVAIPLVAWLGRRVPSHPRQDEVRADRPRAGIGRVVGAVRGVRLHQ